MSPIPLTILWAVFLVWLVGTVLVLAILRAEDQRATDDDTDRATDPYPPSRQTWVPRSPSDAGGGSGGEE